LLIRHDQQFRPCSDVAPIPVCDATSWNPNAFENIIFCSICYYKFNVGFNKISNAVKQY
jgi:hypothetical protein